MPAKRSRVPGKGQTAVTKRGAASRRPQAPTGKPSRFGFIGDTITEMKKVTWLTRREAMYLSGLVLLVSVTVGAILGLIDLGLSSLVNITLLGG